MLGLLSGVWCEGSQAGRGGCESQAFVWESGAHWRGERRAHQQIVSVPGDAAVKALGAIDLSSLLEPIGGSGSEERNQWFPEANLWDKDHCQNDFLWKPAGKRWRRPACVRCVLAAWALVHEGNQICTMEIHSCNQYLLSSTSVLARCEALGFGGEINVAPEIPVLSGV